MTRGLTRPGPGGPGELIIIIIIIIVITIVIRFFKARDAGMKVDEFSYTTVINACANGLDVGKAEQWMARMLESGQMPNVVSFNAVITACAKAGQSERALLLLQQMRAAGAAPNAITYNAALSACATTTTSTRSDKQGTDAKRGRRGCSVPARRAFVVASPPRRRARARARARGAFHHHCHRWGRRSSCPSGPQRCTKPRFGLSWLLRAVLLFGQWTA